MMVHPFQIESIRIGRTYRVMVTHVESPYLFYAILTEGTKPIDVDDEEESFPYNKDDFNLYDYKVMMDDMKNFYKSKHPENLDVFPAMGSLVAVECKGQFHRGRVISLDMDESKCLIFDIDTGTNSFAERKHVYNLDQSFGFLPALALQCCLDDVKPRGERYDWPKEVR